jgi:hypothetical protein
MANTSVLPARSRSSADDDRDSADKEQARHSCRGLPRTWQQVTLLERWGSH